MAIGSKCELRLINHQVDDKQKLVIIFKEILMNKTVYPNYGGLARPAMMMGIPVAAFASVFIASTLLTLFGFLVIGGMGLLFLLLPVPVLMLFRTLCADDDQALSVIGYELMCFFNKRNAKHFNRTLTIVPDKKETKQDFVKFFNRMNKKDKTL